ncbi:hypothetical protein BH23BAC3_BH23BAC3_30480 [soil metagenome]
MHLQRIDEPIILDGVVDEPFWQSIDPLIMTMHVPTYDADYARLVIHLFDGQVVTENMQKGFHV